MKSERVLTLYNMDLYEVMESADLAMRVCHRAVAKGEGGGIVGQCPTLKS